MQCPKCKSEWQVGTSITTMHSNCPFCGASLAEEKTEPEKKPENITDVLKMLIGMYGKDLYCDKKRLKALLSDYATPFNKERKRINLAIIEGIPEKLYQADSKDKYEKNAAVQESKLKLMEIYDIPEQNATELVNWFVTALDRQKTIVIQCKVMKKTSESALSLKDAIALYEGDKSELNGKRVIEIVKGLVSKGINAADSDGNTMVTLASYAGYTDIVKVLISAGADIEAKDHYGYTALMWAALIGHTETVKVLIYHRYAERAGANIEAKGNDGCTALISASGYGHTEIVEALIKANTDVNVQNNEGWTALMIASGYGYTEIVEALIKANADVNVQNNDGETALILASSNGHIEMVKALISADASIEAKENYGYTALMYASGHGHTETVRVLIAARADLNIQDNDDYNALMWASSEGHTEIVELLKAAGATE